MSAKISATRRKAIVDGCRPPRMRAGAGQRDVQRVGGELVGQRVGGQCRVPRS